MTRTPTSERDGLKCDRCDAHARWSICNVEGDDMQPIGRWLACGRHLHTVLANGQWDMDCVHVYDWERRYGDR